MASFEDGELNMIRERVGILQEENRRLQLQLEIEAMQKHLGEHEIATPKPSSELNMAVGFDTCRQKLPNVETSHMETTESRAKRMSCYDSPEQFGIPTVHRNRKDGNTEDIPSWDRFVTRRKRNTKPDTNQIQAKSQQTQTKTHSTHTGMMKPATFDGTVSWQDYKAHFEACASINGWSSNDKGLYLAVSLRGQAQGVLSNTVGTSNDYEALVSALQDRYAPPNQTELYRAQLRDRRQKASESLSELAQDIRRLTNLSYPSAPAEVKETLAKEQFVDSLVSSDMRLRVKQARPINLNDAVRHAVELEAFVRAERTKFEGQGMLNAAYSTSKECIKQEQEDQSELQLLRKAVERLENVLKSSDLKKRAEEKKTGHDTAPNHERNRFGGNRKKRRCFECDSESHIRPDCPKLKNKNANNDKDRPVNHVSSVGSGMYAKCRINTIPTECLIDTGASVTIVSLQLWDKVKQSTTSVLETFDHQVYTACGDPVDMKGKTTVSIEVGGIHCICPVVIANIEQGIVLGLDFLKTQNCQVDIPNNVLTIQGKRCKLNCIGSMGCYRIFANRVASVTTKRVRCGICNVSFKKTAYLKQHNRRRHAESVQTVEKSAGLCGRTEQQVADVLVDRKLSNRKGVSGACAPEIELPKEEKVPMEYTMKRSIASSFISDNSEKEGNNGTEIIDDNDSETGYQRQSYDSVRTIDRKLISPFPMQPENKCEKHGSAKAMEIKGKVIRSSPVMERQYASFHDTRKTRGLNDIPQSVQSMDAQKDELHNDNVIFHQNEFEADFSRSETRRIKPVWVQELCDLLGQ